MTNPEAGMPIAVAIENLEAGSEIRRVLEIARTAFGDKTLVFDKEPNSTELRPAAEDSDNTPTA